MKFVSRAWRKLKQPKVLGIVLVVAFAALIVAPVLAQPRIDVPTPAEPTLPDFVEKTIIALAQAYLRLVQPLLNSLISQVVWVSGYSDFVNSLPVVTGWVIVRDIANMFFIIVLLIVAFGTILGQEQYHYKKLLPKLLLLAILVNFSRTIVGVFTDAAQVVMLTFVNGYSASAGGNFAQMFGITELLKADASCLQLTAGGALNVQTQTVGFLLAAILVTISVITVFVVLAVLILRVIMLWLLTILSPIAFLTGTFPQGQKYYAQWWKEFTDQAVVGPMLAFFLWLSLVTAGGGNAYTIINTSNAVQLDAAQSAPTGCTSAGTAPALASFIISIMMLLAGVQMSQQMGGAISGVAGRAKGFATKFAKSGFGARYAWKYGGKQTAGFLDRQQGRFTGIQFAKIPGRFKEALKERREKNEQAIKDRGYRLAGAAQKYVGALPIAGRPLAGIYGALAAPDVLVKSFLTRGIMARTARGLQGSALYKFRHADKAEKERKQAGVIDEGLATEKTQYEINKSNLVVLAQNSAGYAVLSSRATAGTALTPAELVEQAELTAAITAAAPDEIRWRTDTGTYEDISAENSRATSRQKSARLNASAAKSEGKYARGEVRYDVARENVQFRQESEAQKTVDLTRSTNELIGDLERAVAKRDQATAALLSKTIAQRGDTGDMLKRFGITATGVAGLHEYKNNVLRKQAGLDQSYADKTAVRMSEHAWKAGDMDYGNAYRVDPITNEVKEQSGDEAANISAKRMEGKSISSILSSIKPGALSETTSDGKERMSGVAAALLARTNSESPRVLADLLRRGLFPAEIMRVMKGQLGVLETLASAGTLRPEIVEGIRTAPVAPPGLSTENIVSEILRVRS